jgi:hypothetical protein
MLTDSSYQITQRKPFIELFPKYLFKLMQSRFINDYTLSCNIESLPGDIFNLLSSFLVTLEIRNSIFRTQNRFQGYYGLL